MIVCHCLGLNHRDIERAVRDGARTVAQISRHCGAASDCRGCAVLVRALLREAVVEQAKVIEAQIQTPSV